MTMLDRGGSRAPFCFGAAAQSGGVPVVRPHSLAAGGWP